MEIVPLVGSLIGSIPAILIALTVSWQLALVVVVIFLAGNFMQGNFVAPYVYSRSVNVSPVMITFALLIGGNLMGIAGALIAVPVMAAIQVLVQNLYVEPMERRALIEAAPEGAGPLGPDVGAPASGPGGPRSGAGYNGHAVERPDGSASPPPRRISNRLDGEP